MVLITHERLTSGEITKRYLSDVDANMHTLVPPPQPYYYLRGFSVGIIEGEMSFDFDKKQCFLPTDGYFEIKTPEQPVFSEGKLPLPQELFGCPGFASLPESLLISFLPVELGREDDRYQLAVGDDEIAKLILEDGLGFTFKVQKMLTEEEKILRAKKAARDAQK